MPTLRAKGGGTATTHESVLPLVLCGRVRIVLHACVWFTVRPECRPPFALFGQQRRLCKDLRRRFRRKSPVHFRRCERRRVGALSLSPHACSMLTLHVLPFLPHATPMLSCLSAPFTISTPSHRPLPCVCMSLTAALHPRGSQEGGASPEAAAQKRCVCVRVCVRGEKRSSGTTKQTKYGVTTRWCGGGVCSRRAPTRASFPLSLHRLMHGHPPLLL